MGFLTKRTYSPVFHSTAWYGPEPTTGLPAVGVLVKPLLIWAYVTLPQMCSGRIGTYAWRTRGFGSLSVTTRVVSSVATALTMLTSLMYGSR